MYLNKYHRSVNTIVTEIFQFRGWISIKGLPFDSRCTNTFEIIDNQCGGLMRIDRKTSKFHFLIEASVRVKAKGIVAIPQIIHFGSQGTNIPIMLTPLFTLETAFQSNQQHPLKGPLSRLPNQINKSCKPSYRGRSSKINKSTHLQFKIQKIVNWVQSSTSLKRKRLYKAQRKTTPLIFSRKPSTQGPLKLDWITQKNSYRIRSFAQTWRRKPNHYSQKQITSHRMILH